MSTNSDPQDELDERAAQIATLRELIKSNRRRLNQRQLQAAKAGFLVDPSITLDIEDLNREIAKLERELKSLVG